MYMLLNPSIVNTKIDSYVTFRIKERVQRICIWINQNFLLDEEIELGNEDTKELHVRFLCLRDKSYLDMDFGADGLVKFTTLDISLAGELVQSLAIYLNLSDLQVCYFSYSLYYYIYNTNFIFMLFYMLPFDPITILEQKYKIILKFFAYMKF